MTADGDDFAESIDATLVGKVALGDERAFEQLVRRHLRTALSVARSKLSIEDDAGDVCQEAFMIALQRIDECREPSRFRAWFLAIVRNQAHKRRDYERVRNADRIEDVPSIPSRADPQRDLDRSELRRDLKEALTHLTDLQRRVVVLHDLEGWAHREISDELGISYGSCRVHLSTARRRMRRVLMHEYKGNGS